MFLLYHWRQSQNLAKLPLEIMQHGHISHDYPWPFVFYLNTIIYSMQLDNVQGADF